MPRRCARPTGVIMVAPPEVPRNAEGAHNAKAARTRMNGKEGRGLAGIIKAEAP
jgi:hypothetical protein